MTDSNPHYDWEAEFSDELEVCGRIEVQDAIERIAALVPGNRGFYVNVGALCDTDSPYVRRLSIDVVFERNTLPQTRSYTVWVDDLELLFRLVDEAQ
jgi:hypothetical protein